MTTVRSDYCSTSIRVLDGRRILTRLHAAVMTWVVVVVGWVSVAQASPEIYPLSKVRRGQKGYGFTTTAGTKPTRFEFEVIGVAKNFLPKMDIILVKSDDPMFKISGFWQGMSGSPLYIEGKLTCAFSYGFSFNKLPIGGCTPLEYMKREGFRPRQFSPYTVRAGSQPGTQSAKAAMASMMGLVTSSNSAAESAAKKPWLLSVARPVSAEHAVDPQGMTPSSVPLAMSGYSSAAFELARKMFAGHAVTPMRAAGGGSRNSGPSAFEQGSSIGVQVVRGDMSIAATGTVSYVDGNNILAFGHPFLHAGEIYAPVTTSLVHTIIPSARSAFVMASPLREVGSLTQDRQSTIAADTSVATPLIPMRIRIASLQGGKTVRESFDVELLNNRFFTASLAGLAVMNAVNRYIPDRERASAVIHSRIKLRGHKPLSFTDYAYSDLGAAGLVSGARGVRALMPIMLNPFAPVKIESIDVDVEILYGANFGKLVRLELPAGELIPGKRNYVDVVMTRYDGKEVTEHVPFDVPRSLEGALVEMVVSAGDAARPEMAPPKSLSDYLEIARKLLPGNVFAVTLYTGEQGTALDGTMIGDVPPSVLDRLASATRPAVLSSYRRLSRSVYPTKRVLHGTLRIVIPVAELD